MRLLRLSFFISWLIVSAPLNAQRIPVLNQIDLPHNYYYREMYLPQLTDGPSSVAWMTDGNLVYSMGGSLWKQKPGSNAAAQLTDDIGYDYQPDVSPDGTRIVFVRYSGGAMDLMLLDLQTKKTYTLTNNQSVNLEPRWSPDGLSIAFVSTFQTGHFVLHTARIEGNELSALKPVIEDHKSDIKRYYYSAYDHAINPCWSKDGKFLYFISNREVAHGTGNLCRLDLQSGEIKTLHREETGWRTRPDLSPDGSRFVYSSYLGQNWQQLWMLPSAGGYPVPLTYGDYDKTSPRWSPDGKKIAFVSNQDGNTSLRLVDAFTGGQESIIPQKLNYLSPHISITIRVQDEKGNIIPARISITDTREKFYSPAGSWIQADDSRYTVRKKFENHYFYSPGEFTLQVPVDKITIRVSHGPAYEIANVEVNAKQAIDTPIVITLKPLQLPADFGTWQSGDVHLHMNYGGNYRNTPENFVRQGEAEDLNYMFSLAVNKEQRIPDISYFSTAPDKASNEKVMMLYGQEFHTSVWGHLGLLNLKSHLILPDYSGYPQTAVASLFPHNGFIADRAHEQSGFVGYVHPFEQSEIFPDQSAGLNNMLPVDAALGKVDYYELVGFSDHRASEAVWYQLLNAGLHIPAAAGTDVMGNYASLRGPVGQNRVYVKGNGTLKTETFLEGVMKGRSFVTNGPLIGFRVNDAVPGEKIYAGPRGITVSYSGFLRSQTALNHVEVVLNGEVVASHVKQEPTRNLDIQGKLKVKGPGWILLRAWNSSAQPEVQDIYPYASTNPVYIDGSDKSDREMVAGRYFLKWLDRLEKLTNSSDDFREEAERLAILNDIKKARMYYEKGVKAANP